MRLRPLNPLLTVKNIDEMRKFNFSPRLMKIDKR